MYKQLNSIKQLHFTFWISSWIKEKLKNLQIHHHQHVVDEQFPYQRLIKRGKFRMFFLFKCVCELKSSKGKFIHFSKSSKVKFITHICSGVYLMYSYKNLRIYFTTFLLIILFSSTYFVRMMWYRTQNPRMKMRKMRWVILNVSWIILSAVLDYFLACQEN